MAITTLHEEHYPPLTLSRVEVTEPDAEPAVLWDVWCEECGDFAATRCHEIIARHEIATHQHSAPVVDPVAELAQLRRDVADINGQAGP